MKLRSDLLPSLGVFAAAARHQNLARAADELHLTASAVSHHVRKLEARLGVVLFQRHARGVSLTPEGRELADASETALGDIEAVLGALHGRRDVRDRVRVTTMHSLAYTWLMPRLHRFSKGSPQVRISVDTECSLARFDESGPEVGIRFGPGEWPGLTAHHLMGDALFPVAARDLAGVDEVSGPADIARLPLVSDLTPQGWREWFRAAGVRGARLPRMHSFSDTTDALQAAVHGLGAALARERIVTPYLASGKLMRLPGPALKARFAYYVVYSSQRHLSPSALAFVDWLRKEAQDDLPRHEESLDPVLP